MAATSTPKWHKMMMRLLLMDQVIYHVSRIRAKRCCCWLFLFNEYCTLQLSLFHKSAWMLGFPQFFFCLKLLKVDCENRYCRIVYCIGSTKDIWHFWVFWVTMFKWDNKVDLKREFKILSNYHCFYYHFFAKKNSWLKISNIFKIHPSLGSQAS